MNIKVLTIEFYTQYKDCNEILHKENRPYFFLTLEIDGLMYAIPFRHHISHSYAFRTIENAGIDFSKAVVVIDESYISDINVNIDSAEYKILKRNENKIKVSFNRYIKQFKKALKNKHIPRNRNFIKFSALQYFEEYLINK